MRRLILLAAACALLAACGKDKAADSGQAEANIAQGAVFLAKNAKEPGVQATPSGLQYKIIRSGPASGARPGPNDEVKVHYEGKLLNGEVFDSSYAEGVPAIFRPSEVIPGWTEALQMMRPGDEWMLYIPANIAYGNDDKGPLPGGSLLTFKVELLAVRKAG